MTSPSLVEFQPKFAKPGDAKSTWAYDPDGPMLIASMLQSHANGTASAGTGMNDVWNCLRSIQPSSPRSGRSALMTSGTGQAPLRRSNSCVSERPKSQRRGH